MGLIILLVLGAGVGWIASIITKRDAEQGWIMNIIVGVIGAIIGGAISSLLGEGDRSALTWDLSSLLWSLGGAVVLCLILNYLKRGRVR